MTKIIEIGAVIKKSPHAENKLFLLTRHQAARGAIGLL